MTSKKSKKKTKQKKNLTYESSNHINVKKYPILYLSILYHTSSKEKKKTNKQSFQSKSLVAPQKWKLVNEWVGPLHKEATQTWKRHV